MAKTFKGVRRFDFGEMRQATRTPQGFLKVPGFATRTGVFPYLDGEGNIRRELRHPDDVFDPESLVTLQYAPVTLEHPPVMITPDNVAQYSKGHTTERVEVNREMVDVDLIVEHQDGIDAIEKDGVRELSSGYIADIVEESGTYNGAPYNFRQKNIKYNHLAMVKRGRAGPEVRMRLDSKDAVMRTDDISVPEAGEFSQESGVYDAEEKAVKKIVITGREIDLPSDIADTIQDMLDRYDEMRAKISELEDEMAKTKGARKDKADVDISQPGVSPQVKVEQQGPDGTKAGKKIGPGQSQAHPDAEEEMDGDEHGIVGGVHPNSRDDDDDDEKHDDDDDDHKDDEELENKKDKKKDFEPAGHAGAGGGGAMSPFDKLKSDYDALSAKHDEMKAKMDEYAAASMSSGEAKPDRMDAKGIRTAVKMRVKLERQAEKLVPFEIAKKFDSMTDEQIRMSVIKHRHPKADLEGKSTTYLESRFDSIVEGFEEEGSSTRSKVGRQLMGVGDGEERTDGADVDPDQARLKMRSASAKLWQSNLSATKK